MMGVSRHSGACGGEPGSHINKGALEVCNLALQVEDG
jgi:hypothetical protein